MDKKPVKKKRKPGDVIVEPEYDSETPVKKTTMKEEKKGGPAGKSVLKAQSMNSVNDQNTDKDVADAASYFLHVLYAGKDAKGLEDQKTEILKMKHSGKDHPDDKKIMSFIQSHPITAIHKKNGYDYRFSIGSKDDNPTRMSELTSLAKKNVQSNSHKKRIWESLASEINEDAFLDAVENLKEQVDEQ